MSPPITSNSYIIGTPVKRQLLVLRNILGSEEEPLSQRFRALFSLRHLAVHAPAREATYAIECIAAAFTSPSALLKHELAYCLGQTHSLEAAPYLKAVLEDRQEDAMCRHEAAEALGALGDESSLDLLKSIKDDENEPVVVRETCEIAVDRIMWEKSEQSKTETLKKSNFASVDPAPPMSMSADHDVDALRKLLSDTSLPLFDRYRAMFALRDLASPRDAPTAEAAIHALASGFDDPSALFRHEIAFVFGQLSHPASIPSLVSVLENHEEAGMVRHEAAEALGSLGETPGVEEILKRFLNDPEQVVRESVVVALDMAEHENSGEMEYATTF